MDVGQHVKVQPGMDVFGNVTGIVTPQQSNDGTIWVKLTGYVMSIPFHREELEVISE